MENINTSKLVSEIKELTAEIRKHKQNYKRPWPPFGRWDRESRKIVYDQVDDRMKFGERVYHPSASLCMRQNLAFRVTVLCALRAHLRGKLHLHGATFEEQEKFLKANLKYWSGLVIKQAA